MKLTNVDKTLDTGQLILSSKSLNLKGTVMQIIKAMINNRLRVSKVF